MRKLPLYVVIVALAAAPYAMKGARAGNVLSGIVVSADGVPVNSAQVFWQAADGKSPHALRTDNSGRFQTQSVRAGLYEVRAQARGMWSEWEHNVVVRPVSGANVTLRLVRMSPPPAMPAAELKGTVREFVVPIDTADPRPHDPVVDPQGNIWVTLQNANQVGRLDPKTGEWKLFPVPTKGGGPHGIACDASGNIWFTESAGNKIGRLDARTGVITEYAVPEAMNVHTPAFGADGMLYFTVANSNFIGRLDPKTGQFGSYPVPTAKATPNTIALGPDGGLWFVEFGTNKIGRLDPKTGTIAEFVIPDEKQRPRRMVVSGQALYFTDFGGRLGRYDIAAKKFDSWPTPSGAGSQPYGIGADGAGKIWYYETVPNQMVRFDPKTEKLDVFPMPTAKSNVVAMTSDAQGRVWVAMTGVSKIAVIE